jgi:hypothetical protein
VLLTQARASGRPTVVSMSLGGGISTALDNAVTTVRTSLILSLLIPVPDAAHTNQLTSAGIHVVVSILVINPHMSPSLIQPSLHFLSPPASIQGRCRKRQCRRRQHLARTRPFRYHRRRIYDHRCSIIVLQLWQCRRWLCARYQHYQHLDWQHHRD